MEKPQTWTKDRPDREQRELGVVSTLTGSSLTGRGRGFTWGFFTNRKSDSGPFEVLKLPWGSSEHTSITDCSTQRRTPRSGNGANTIFTLKKKKALVLMFKPEACSDGGNRLTLQQEHQRKNKKKLKISKSDCWGLLGRLSVKKTASAGAVWVSAELN